MDDYTKYILFLAQEANFQTRSLLISYEEFMKVRKDDYDILKQAVTKVNDINLIIQNYKWQDNCGTQEIHTHTKIVNQLMRYADGMDEDCYLEMKDKLWYDQSKGNFCKGFNHVKNYKEWVNKPNIVDSFLVLTTDDGKLNIPTVDTVEELLQKYYLH